MTAFGARRMRAPRTPQERFNSLTGWPTKTACRLWKGSTTDKGYGRFHLGDRIVRAHRFAWERIHGRVPAGKVLRNLCGHRCCVNPNHWMVSEVAIGFPGARHPNWKGGKSLNRHGYIRRLIPADSPFAEMGHAAGAGVRVAEHRLVVAEALGRPLRTNEHVHHINGDKADNSLGNLLLVDGDSAHRQLHKLQRQLNESNELEQIKRQESELPILANRVGAGEVSD